MALSSKNVTSLQERESNQGSAPLKLKTQQNYLEVAATASEFEEYSSSRSPVKLSLSWTFSAMCFCWRNISNDRF